MRFFFTVHTDNSMTTVKKSAGYSACYATEAFGAGAAVLALQGPLLQQPTRESIELGPGRHIVDPTGSFVNHHADPSTRVDQQRQCLVALRPVQTGDEITFDYNLNETSMAAPFVTSDGTTVAGRQPFNVG
jgi:hypothetical protein